MAGDWTMDLEIRLRMYEAEVVNPILGAPLEEVRAVTHQALSIFQGRVLTLTSMLRTSLAAGCLASSVETLPISLSIQTATNRQQLKEILLKIYKMEKLFIQQSNRIASGIF